MLLYLRKLSTKEYALYAVGKIRGHGCTASGHQFHICPSRLAPWLRTLSLYRAPHFSKAQVVSAYQRLAYIPPSPLLMGARFDNREMRGDSDKMTVVSIAQERKGFRSNSDHNAATVTPNQLRWRPFELPNDPVDFVTGLHTICGAGRWHLLLNVLCPVHYCIALRLTTKSESGNLV